MSPYVDAIGLEAGSTNAAIVALVEQNDPSAGIVLLGEPLGEDPAAGARRFLEGHLNVLGTKITGVTYSAPTPVVAAALAPIAFLRGLLGQELVTLDDKASGLRLTRAGTDVTAEVRHRLLFGLGSSTTYFVYAAPMGTLELVLSSRPGLGRRR